VTEAHLFDPQTLYRHWEDERRRLNVIGVPLSSL
jgi:hypothetical protein